MHAKQFDNLIITTSALLLVAVPAMASDEPVAVTDDADTTESIEVVELAELPQLQAEPISMDRSDWPTIVISPADGKTTHNPAYMGDVPMGEDIVSPLHASDPVWQIEEALRGADAGNWNGENLADLGAQPFIALGRFIAIPFFAILEHPWSEDTSPK